MGAVPPRRAAVALLIAVAWVMGPVACSEDQSACKAVESLQRAYDRVRAIEVHDEEIADVSGALLDLNRAAVDAAEAGASQDEVDDLETDIEDLQRTLSRSSDGAGGEDRDRTALEPDLDRVLDDTDDLLADISEDC